MCVMCLCVRRVTCVGEMFVCLRQNVFVCLCMSSVVGVRCVRGDVCVSKMRVCDMFVSEIAGVCV